MKKKRFAVIGLGKFGSYLARDLSGQGHVVVGIDKNEKLVEEISESISEAVVADARKRDVLKNLNLDRMDTVVVAVGSMTPSVLITLYLKELGCRHILAKAIDEDHATLLSLVGAHEVTIPERDAAVRMAQRLSVPNLVDFLPMLPEYCLAEVQPPDEFIGRSLAELDIRKRFNLYVIGIRSDADGSIHLMPSADHVIRQGESLYVLARKEDLEKITSLAGKRAE